MAKGFLVKNFKSFHQTFQEKICYFIAERKKRKMYEDLKWFSRDKNEVKKILEENYKIL